MKGRRQRSVKSEGESRLRVLPGEGRPFAHMRQKVVFHIVLILTALLILQAGYHWMAPFIMARRLQIVTADVGIMEQRIEVQGMIMRQEELLRAPCAGIIVELAPAGERAAAGTVAAVLAPLSAEECRKLVEGEEKQAATFWERIKAFFFNGRGGGNEGDENSELIMAGEAPPWLAERVDLVIPRAGLLLHRLDGWENPGETFYLTAEEYAAAGKKIFAAREGLYVEADEPILKVIDNWQWSYHVLLPLDSGRIAAAWSNIQIEFPFAPGQPVSAKLEDLEIDADKEEARLSYCIKKQFPGCEDLRWSPAELIFERREGIIIPAEALVEREDVTGVFLNLGGRVRFKAVTLIRMDGERAMVGDLDPGSMVIGRPGLVEEGRRLE